MKGKWSANSRAVLEKVPWEPCTTKTGRGGRGIDGAGVRHGSSGGGGSSICKQAGGPSARVELSTAGGNGRRDRETEDEDGTERIR
jgi:hypothetical protein